MAKISIITPSLNQGKYLRRTIESVLNQGVDLEYIVVDGCSTDGSIDILKSLNSKVHIIIEKDKGQADAISKGFSLAKGEILAWLNSDDIYLPGALKRVISAFDQGYEFIYGHVIIIDSKDKILRRRIVIPVDFNDLYYGKYVLPQESTFFSRKLYFSCGGIDASYNYAMDYDLWLRMALIESPRMVDDFFACFRFHKDQKSRRADLYEREMGQARSNFEKIYRLEKFQCLSSRYSVKFRKLFANIESLGLKNTLVDIINKKLRKLP